MAPTPTATTDDRARAYLARTDRYLEDRLPGPDELPSRLHDAMRYSVLAPGKRIRPLLAYGAGEALDVDADRVDAMAAAVELIHAYSLIHDDLPAMDDDDLRRGRPTCHRAFDEATAILAGDALQALAFELLTTVPGVDAAACLAMVRTLARACGSRGMAGGQAIDLDSVGRTLERSDLERMHGLKTGALIRCAVELPAVAIGDLNSCAALGSFGERIGLAFQIQDDVLDVEGSTDHIGKPQGSDQAQGKPTFPSCIGLDESKRLAQDLLAEAIDELRRLPGSTVLLEHLARFTVERKR